MKRIINYTSHKVIRALQYSQYRSLKHKFIENCRADLGWRSLQVANSLRAAIINRLPICRILVRQLRFPVSSFSFPLRRDKDGCQNSSKIFNFCDQDLVINCLVIMSSLKGMSKSDKETKKVSLLTKFRIMVSCKISHPFYIKLLVQRSRSGARGSTSSTSSAGKPAAKVMLTSSASSDKSSDPSNIDPLNLASLVGSKPAGSKASTEAKSEDPSIQMSVSYIFTIILRIPKTSKPKITYYPFSKVDGVPDDPNNEITPDVFSYDINVQGMNKAKVGKRWLVQRRSKPRKRPGSRLRWRRGETKAELRPKPPLPTLATPANQR